MKILIAPDSFKGSLTALEAGKYIDDGVKEAIPGAITEICPLADGGEGTVEAMVNATSGKIITIKAKDPLLRSIEVSYGIIGNGEQAVIEMSAASGLLLLSDEERDPMITSTYGTGEMIKDALEKGIKKIIVGIGGSATNDGGTGMARALSYRFLASKGNEIAHGGGGLSSLAVIDHSKRNSLLDKAKIVAACDVNNPLTGEQGASAVYGPQKGADKKMVDTLDKNLGHLAACVKEQLGKDLAEVPGAGAAGGLGFGLMAFAGAEIRPGFEIIKEAIGLEKKIANCDLVITGEGKIDQQSIYGKGSFELIKLAKSYQKPIIIICGKVDVPIEELKKHGVIQAAQLISNTITTDQAMRNAGSLLQNVSCKVIKEILASK